MQSSFFLIYWIQWVEGRLTIWFIGQRKNNAKLNQT